MSKNGHFFPNTEFCGYFSQKSVIFGLKMTFLKKVEGKRNIKLKKLEMQKWAQNNVFVRF